MKEIAKTIKTVTTLGFILICVCLFNNTQVKAAEPTPETVIDMDAVVDFVVNDNSLYLFFNDGTGYYWEKGTEEVEENITAEYIDTTLRNIYNNYIDMCLVTGFVVNDGNLQIYLNDNTGYYWER